MRGADKIHYLHEVIVLKSGNLNLLEPSGYVQTSNGIALPFTKRGTEGACINGKSICLLFQLL